MSQKYSKNIMKIQLFGTTNEGDNNAEAVANFFTF